MNFSEIHIEDERWTERERVILDHLFRTVKRYGDEGRRLEQHGVKKAIYVFGNVMEAFDKMEKMTKMPKPTDFQELL